MKLFTWCRPWVLTLALALGALSCAQAQTINTIAGSGTAGFSGDGGVALAATFRDAAAMTVDAAGNIFVADQGNFRIRRIAAGTNIVTTVVGNGTEGFSDGGGLATAAQIGAEIAAMATDVAGNLFFADTNNHRIRRVTPTGQISTVAGNGTAGYSGEGLATNVRLNLPSGLAIDRQGTLYIGDRLNQRVRMVVGTTISTIAGTGVVGGNTENVPALQATFDRPTRVALDALGRVYVMDVNNNRIRRFTPGGSIQTFAGGFGVPGILPNGDGGPATRASIVLTTFADLAIDGARSLFVADLGEGTIRRVRSTGVIAPVAGGGGGINSFDEGIPALQAQFITSGLAIDRAGGLLISTNNTIRRVSPLTTPAPLSADGFSVPAGGGLPAAALTTTTVGAAGALTVRATLDFSQLPLQSPQATLRYEVYVVALVPGQLFGAPVPFSPFLQNEQRTWGPAANPVQVFARNVDPATLQLNRITITLLDNFDSTLLPGTEFYVGYGVNLDDMLRAGRFRGAFKVLPP